ncbi:MAG: glycoside hydrolase family 32 protein [Chloroflexota bacterium]
MTTPNPAIEKAMASVAAATAKAEADPTRPLYHFRPPANWMNDPNGPIYHNGYYHLFYQHNPYGDGWEHMHWGHTRSTDLVNWEHLPIALSPSLDQGEDHCFSGCAWHNGNGEPMLFYTSVARADQPHARPNEQWAVTCDDDMIVFEKHPSNPILSLENQGGPDFKGPWRDPFIFSEAGRTFLVIGADTEDTAMVALYEANDNSLTAWTYRGLIHQAPKSEVKFFECPNFCKVDGKWILITAPYRRLEYIVGDFDLDTLTFTPENDGILDHGFTADPKALGYGSNVEYYASNIVFDDRGRCILLGWVRGFQAERGWNGCLAIPRLLSIGVDGHPRQMPVPAMTQLRGPSRFVQDLDISKTPHVLDGFASDTAEIEMTFSSSDSVTLQVRRSEDGSRAITIHSTPDTLDVAGTQVPISASTDNRTLRVFLDKSVLEVYLDDGSVAVTRVLYPETQDLGVAISSSNGEATIKALNVWQMQSIW